MDLADGQLPGLFLRVTPTGTMTWSMQYRLVGAGGVTGRGYKVKGKPRFRMTLGRYPAMSIAEAREAGSKYRAMAERGENPVEKLEREATAGSGTVRAIAAEYLEKYVQRARLRSEDKIRYAIEVHIVPEWGDRAAASLSRREVVALLERVLPKRKVGRAHVGGPEAARTVRQVLHRMFEWACRQDILAANPVSGVTDPVKPKSRDRVLTMEELRAVWRAAGTLEYPFGPLYRLLLLTGCRRGEWAKAQWSWLDPKDKELLIPSESHKSRRSHIVPLSKAAMNTIDGLLRWNGGNRLASAHVACR
jgi:integrase